MNWLWWLAVSSLAPIPAVWAYFQIKAQRRSRREAAEVRDFMAARRARFGGAIRQPGDRVATPLERPRP